MFRMRQFLSHRRVVDPSPTVPPGPNPGVITIPAAVRSRNTTGSGLVNGGLFFAPGHVTDEILASRQIKVLVGGVEQSVALNPLRGRFPDGSVRSVLCQFTYNIPDISNDITAEVRIGETRQTSDLSIQDVDATIYNARRVIVISDPSYLCSTWITFQPLITESSENAHNNDYFGTYARARLDALQNSEVDSGNYQSTYESGRGMLARYCATGDHFFYDQFYRRSYSLLTKYSLSSTTFNNGFGTWNPHPNQHNLPGVDADGTPAEQHSQRYLSFACAYYATGLEEYWNVIAAHVQVFNSQINSQAAALGNIGHIHKTWGGRANLIGMWPKALGCIIDSTRVYSLPGKYGNGRVYNYPVEIPWIIDAHAAHAYNVGDYRDGMVGNRSDCTNGGNYGVGRTPEFQQALDCDFLIFYYFNVHADSRIPAMIKKNVDVVWDNNIYPLTSGMPMFGIGSVGYGYMLTETPGAKNGTDPPAVPVWGTDPWTVVMWAPAIAFCKAFYGDAKYTNYLAIATDKNQVLSPHLGWSLKIWGEHYGNSMCTPYLDQVGIPQNLPSSIRTPTQY